MTQPIHIVDKQTDEPFVWLIVTDKSKEIFNSGLFDLYVLYDDESESLIETYDDLNEALSNGLDIGVEVGRLNLKDFLIPDY